MKEVKKFDSVEELVENMIVSNDEIKSLLLIDNLSGIDELCDRNIIVNELNEVAVSNDGIQCRLAILKNDGYLDLAIICNKSVMMLEGIEQRGLKIASLLYNYISTNTVIDDEVLEYVNIKTLEIADEWVTYSLSFSLDIYDEDNYEDEDEDDDLYDEDSIEYLNVYNELWSKIVERIGTNRRLVELLYGKECDTKTLVEEDYIRFDLSCAKNKESEFTRFIYLNVEDGFTFTIGATLVYDDSVDADWISETMEEIEKSMLGLVGTKVLNKNSGEVQDEVKFINLSLSLDISEETLNSIEDDNEVMNKFKISRRPNFFFGLEALNILAEEAMDYDDKTDYDFTVDVIEAPFLVTYTTDDEQSIMRVYLRGEIYSRDDDGNCIGMVTLDKSTGKVSVQAGEDMQDNIGLLYKLCKNLNVYINENSLLSLLKDFDVKNDGILIDTNNGKLVHRIVKGKERPNLLCTTLFGGAQMCRPYTDENSANWMNELIGMNMSLEEKIEKAEEGDEYWIRELSDLYRTGDMEIDADPEKALYWMEKLAETGDSMAQYNAGIMYSQGNGIDRNLEKSLFWMKKASENGDEDATKIIPKLEKAVLAEKKIEEGDAQAQADLASFLMQNRSEENLRECYELCVKSAKQGNANGCYLLGLCYNHGRGCDEDIEKAAEAYKKGADLGDMHSQFNYACLVLNHEVKGNDKEAVELIFESARQGYDLAQAALSSMYEHGKDIEEDLDKAIEWGEKAAEQGNADIQYQVAKVYMYENEDGTMKDADRARFWLAKAAEQGHEMAGGMLNFAPIWGDTFDDEDDETYDGV